MAIAGKPKRANTPYDYFHVNSIQQDTDGNLVVSGRNTWTVYKLTTNGSVIWKLGGKHSSFKMGRNTTSPSSTTHGCDRAARSLCSTTGQVHRSSTGSHEG